MPVLIYPITPQFGAVVHVSLRPANPQFGSIAAPFRGAKMLVDTGADRTTLDCSFIQRWGINATSFTNEPLVTSQGTSYGRRYLYNVFIEIVSAQAGNGHWLVGSVDVGESRQGAFTGCPFQGVIGRDVLEKCSFTYDGLASHFSIRA